VRSACLSFRRAGVSMKAKLTKRSPSSVCIIALVGRQGVHAAIAVLKQSLSQNPVIAASPSATSAGRKQLGPGDIWAKHHVEISARTARRSFAPRKNWCGVSVGSRSVCNGGSASTVQSVARTYAGRTRQAWVTI
jgi:hypothetical protein